MRIKFIKKLFFSIALLSTMCSLVACSEKVSTRDTTSSGNKKSTKLNYNDIKIGIIVNGSEDDTSGYTYAHAKGIEDALKNLGMSKDQVIWKNHIPDDMNNASDQQVITEAEDCIKQGCSLIFASSYGYKNAIKQLSEKHPNVYFAHATGDVSNGTNFINYFGRVYQARYLSGIAAGLKTKTNNIGYVSAWGLENSECTSGINAFAMGVASVNSNAKVYIRTTSTWFNAEKEKSAAEYLIQEKNCDVISQHVDTAEPQIAAQEAGVYGIGYNSDMSKDAPKAVLTSVIWHWDVFYTWAIKSVVEKTWDGKNYLGGLNEGMVSITKLTDLNNPNAQSKIDAATTKMKSGDWDVFTGIIPTNQNTTIGSDGTSLDNNSILFRMNWYYKNVIPTNIK